MKARPGRFAAGAAAAAAILVLGVLAATLSFSRGDSICKGVTISGIQVGGLAKSDASARLRLWARERLGRRITLTAMGRQWSGTLADFGASVRWRQAVDEAYAVGREGNIIQRGFCVLTGGGRRICVDIAINPSALRKMITKVARSVNVPHKDARFRVEDGQMKLERDARGVKLDEERALSDMVRAFQCGGSSVTLFVVPDKPDVSMKDAEGINTLLAEHVTSLNPGKVDRTQNLYVAAKMVNGIILKPGQEFSYNKAVGPRLEGRGFREAQIFVRGKLVPGLGGGVCQVSTTLYNALLLADLKIVERHHHSRTVPYAVPGRDATVAYGLHDLRFVNSNSSPIAILARVNGSRMTVDIYGGAQDRKQVKIFTSEAKRVPAGVTTVIDPNLRPGRRLVMDKGSRGVKVVVYKTIVSADGTQVTQVVSKDRYPRQNAIVAVGARRGTGAQGVRRVDAVHHPRSGAQARVD